MSGSQQQSMGFFQPLEQRTMMSSSPLAISFASNTLTITGNAGVDQITVSVTGTSWTITDAAWKTVQTLANVKALHILGAAGNDKITIGAGINLPETLDGGAGNDTIVGGAGAQTLIGGDGNDSLSGGDGSDKFYGGAGNDSLLGGAGNDSMYGGTGSDLLSGGAGDDILITVGGAATSTLTGGDGLDSFWIDSAATEKVTDLSPTETADGTLHRIDAFQSLKGTAVAKDLLNTALTDPANTISNATYRNFSSDPLFSGSGPTVNDIVQGQVGDCYFLSQLAAYAKIDPMMIKQSIVDLGDGTYAVKFIQNGANKFYRIDADLLSYSATQPAAANLGQGKSLWVALMEKAWTFARNGAGTYTSIESGWMSEVASLFGKTSIFTVISNKDNGNDDLLNIQNQLATGKSVTLGTNVNQVSGSTMVGSHAYTVMSVQSDGNGGYTVTVRNPWAIDGFSCTDGNNDGLVTLTAAQFINDTQAISIATA